MHALFSWEQGTAGSGILEIDEPEYSVFADSPFADNGKLPVGTLQIAFSAAVRQTPDGRLSQQINDALDQAALDGASSGSHVLLGKAIFSFHATHLTYQRSTGTFTEPGRADYWWSAAEKQLNYVGNLCRLFLFSQLTKIPLFLALIHSAEDF